jgi:hypothetical protein
MQTDNIQCTREKNLAFVHGAKERRSLWGVKEKCQRHPTGAPRRSLQAPPSRSSEMDSGRAQKRLRSVHMVILASCGDLPLG